METELIGVRLLVLQKEWWSWTCGESGLGGSDPHNQEFWTHDLSNIVNIPSSLLFGCAGEMFPRWLVGRELWSVLCNYLVQTLALSVSTYYPREVLFGHEGAGRGVSPEKGSPLCCKKGK